MVNPVQLWLTQYDRGELDAEEAAAATVAEYEARIAALEGKVGQLTMELDLVKNATVASRAHQRNLVRHQRPATCSVRRGCQMIELPRSTYYYRSTAMALGLDDARLVDLIGDIQDEFPGYGYRRVTLELRARGHHINHKHAARIMRKHGLGIKPRKHFTPKQKDNVSDTQFFPNLYRNVIPALPNQALVADITFVRIQTVSSTWR